MEISSPTWNAKDGFYKFLFYEQVPVLKGSTPIFLQAESETIDLSSTTLPVIPDTYIESFITEFIQKTTKWFQTPLRLETIKKRLRHTILKNVTLSPLEHTNWYLLDWQPESIIVKSKEFIIYWKVANIARAEAQISADFFGSPTPRAQSPEPSASLQEQPQEEGLRTIQIHNTMDTLVPVGDLPLSDLPTMSFYEGNEDEKSETKRRVREARLRVALAKLKAQRIEEKYYSKYGETARDSESSDLSSDTDSDEYLSNSR